ncbi:MAG: fatty acid desaturase [Saprospiraceae bacterium]|nr:fatty acid desaturase [Saprospiraceae bacterium]
MDAKVFEKELYSKINAYFNDNNISRYANGKMYVKLAVAAAMWTSSLYLLFAYGGANPWLFFSLYVFHCFAQLFILLNIAHDANHGAIFDTPFLNKLMSYSFELSGVNSYMWRELHHAQHHSCMNIDGEDESLVARKLLRFTEKTQKRFIYRFQHLYFWIIYGLFTADWVFFKDFECFFFPHTTYLKNKKHPPGEYVKLFVFKLIYIGYMIVLPILLWEYSIGWVILVFLVGHFIIGIIGAMVIQLTHPLTTAAFPESKNEYPNFTAFVFATTADYSINSNIAACFFGGLHLHVIHHLGPNICHTHYHNLTKIVSEVASKYQVNYRVNPTMYDAVKDHYLHLKSLSH